MTRAERIEAGELVDLSGNRHADGLFVGAVAVTAPAWAEITKGAQRGAPIATRVHEVCRMARHFSIETAKGRREFLVKLGRKHHRLWVVSAPDERGQVETTIGYPRDFQGEA